MPPEENDQPASLSRYLPLGIACCVLGFTIGLYAGLSNSPISATLLGGIFGIITGIVAYLFSKDGRTDLTRFTTSKGFAATIICFCLSSISGTFVGIEIRDGRLFPVVASSEESEKLLDLANHSVDGELLNAEDSLHLLIAQTHLSRLGLDNRTNNQFVRRLGDEFGGASIKRLEVHRNRLNELKTTCGGVEMIEHATVTASRLRTASPNNANVSTVVEDAASLLMQMCDIIRAANDAIESGSSVPAAYSTRDIVHVLEQLRSATTSGSNVPLEIEPEAPEPEQTGRHIQPI